MKVELEAPLNAMLKGCLWMDGSEEGSKGEQDEASEQLAGANHCQKLVNSPLFPNLFRK